MSSFGESTKPLDKIAVRQATASDLQQSLSLIDPLKYTKKTPARKIQKVHGIFYVADGQQESQGFGANHYIVYQLGFSFPLDFYIIGKPIFGDQLDQLSRCELFIRYRRGGTAYRYHFGSYYANIDSDYNSEFGSNFAPNYANQLIKKNFVIEVWMKNGLVGSPPRTVTITSAGDGNFVVDATPYGFKFDISYIRNPQSADEQEFKVQDPVFIKDELSLALPISTFGITQSFTFHPFSYWLDNI